MIGLKIAFSGLVVFLFSIWMFSIARKPPENRRFGGLMVLLAMVSLPAIPIGLLLAIWI
ncbi:hypothetical protein ACNFCJ_21050 [Pseudomonas sp. NY15364]|uniref:hypothetical protein n=1 Tax=Pseudomonas sp. NY15364 TaxID=3400353 RepID=UPI003A8C1C69